MRPFYLFPPVSIAVYSIQCSEYRLYINATCLLHLSLPFLIAKLIGCSDSANVLCLFLVLHNLSVC